MKVYTKTGDGGTTSLFGGTRVKKNHQRVEAYGTIDELSSFMGLAKVKCEREDIQKTIEEIQITLFTVGAELATEDPAKLRTTITDEQVSSMEAKIDLYMEEVGESFSFKVPGETEASAYMHVVRTICRRAERRIITLMETESVNQNVVKYLNRVSDLFYALSRVCE